MAVHFASRVCAGAGASPVKRLTISTTHGRPGTLFRIKCSRSISTSLHCVIFRIFRGWCSLLPREHI